MHTAPLQSPLSPPSALGDGAIDALSVVDSPAEWGAFSRKTGTAGEWESNVLIEGMHCAGCAMDPLVDENYYQAGLEINKTLAMQPESLAPALQARNHAATGLVPPAKNR